MFTLYAYQPAVTTVCGGDHDGDITSQQNETPGNISISVLWWPKLRTSQSMITANMNTKTMVFSEPLPSLFVSKPNQSIKTVLWWIRIRNTAATRNVPFELCGFAEICLTKMYSGDWVCAETCSLSYLQLRCISMISHMLLVQLKQTRCIFPVSAVGLSWC